VHVCAETLPFTRLKHKFAAAVRPGIKQIQQVVHSPRNNQTRSEFFQTAPLIKTFMRGRYRFQLTSQNNVDAGEYGGKLFGWQSSDLFRQYRFIDRNNQ